MAFILTLTLLYLPFRVDSATLAAAGYYASHPLFRNAVVASGLGHKFRSQADVLYQLSGFRGVSDQGIGRRRANSIYHDIVEVDAGELARRYGLILPSSQVRVKRDHPSHEEKQQMEKLFSVAQSMDRKFCVSRVVCEIGANPKKFGQPGVRIHHYISNMPPVPWNSAAYSYTEAFAIGMKGGLSACFEDYGTCSYDLQKLIKRLQTSGIPMKMFSTPKNDQI